MTDLTQTTTTKHYGLVSLATEAEAQALERWLAAGRAYEADRSPLNLAALIDARDALKKVTEQAQKARDIYKHTHFKRFADGADNSTKASMIDAGLL